MKKLILLSCLFLAGNLLAQKNGHFSFKGEFTEDGEKTSNTIDLYVSTTKTVIYTVEKGVTEEKVIIDHTAKQVLELFTDLEAVEEEQKYYALTNVEDGIEESAVISDALDGAIGMTSLGDLLIMSNEKKTIASLPCQKFTYEDDQVKISGWIATGVHIKLDDELSYLDTKNGIMLEFEMTLGGGYLKQTCISYDPAFSAKDPVFSMDIPAGYENLDENLNLDGSDDYEDYEDSEE